MSREGLRILFYALRSQQSYTGINMLDRYLSANEAMIIDYRPIITLLEEALNERTNGFNQISKETQAEIDHIQTLLDSYESILEDIDSEGGISPRAAELDEISQEAVRLLVDLQLIPETDSGDWLELVPVATIEPEDDEEDTEESDDE